MRTGAGHKRAFGGNYKINQEGCQLRKAEASLVLLESLLTVTLSIQQ